MLDSMPPPGTLPSGWREHLIASIKAEVGEAANEVDWEGLEWLQELLNAFEDIEEQLKKKDGITTRSGQRKHRRLTNAELDAWLLETVRAMRLNAKWMKKVRGVPLQATDKQLIHRVHMQLLCVPEWIKALWTGDKVLQCVASCRPSHRFRTQLWLMFFMHNRLDRTTGLLEYIPGARSSLPRWALALPSPAVLAAVGAPTGLQNFHIVIALLLLQERDWIDDFIECVQDLTGQRSLSTARRLILIYFRRF